jgi:hypothetical protein
MPLGEMQPRLAGWRPPSRTPAAVPNSTIGCRFASHLVVASSSVRRVSCVIEGRRRRANQKPRPSAWVPSTWCLCAILFLLALKYGGTARGKEQGEGLALALVFSHWLVFCFCFCLGPRGLALLFKVGLVPFIMTSGCALGRPGRRSLAPLERERERVSSREILPHKFVSLAPQSAATSKTL